MECGVRTCLAQPRSGGFRLQVCLGVGVGGAHLEGRAMKTPGVKGTHTYIKGLGGKGWPEIRAAIAPGQQSCFICRSQGP